MDKRRNKYYDKNKEVRGKVILMAQAQLVRDAQIRLTKPIKASVVKKSKLDIAREIADEVSFHGKAFGRNMREHYKQGR